MEQPQLKKKRIIGGFGELHTENTFKKGLSKQSRVQENRIQATEI